MLLAAFLLLPPRERYRGVKRHTGTSQNHAGENIVTAANLDDKTGGTEARADQGVVIMAVRCLANMALELVNTHQDASSAGTGPSTVRGC